MHLRGGQVLFDGQDLAKLPPSRVHRLRPRGISMVFQDPLAALNPVLRVGDQITEAIAANAASTRRARRAAAIELLEGMGVDQAVDKLGVYPHQLSGGQRQRVMLAMAMANDPRLLLADEPTSALDVSTQAQILQLLRRLATERQLAILFVSHDYAVVSQICSKVCVMYGGHLVEEGPTETVLRHSAHPYTRGLIASLPSLTARRHRLPVIPGRAPEAGLIADGCPFYPRCTHGRPEVCTTGPVTLMPAAPAHTSACRRFQQIYPEYAPKG
jgi:oligopeptide/dipeptide ABC transporter ATP-binding protein